MKNILKAVLLILLIVVMYKSFLQFVVEYWGYWLYTLILLITPVVLFIMIGRLQATVWKKQPSLMRVLIFCMSVSITAGICIGIVDYIVMNYKLKLFGTSILHQVDSSILAFLLNYLTWYSAIGLLSSILIWGILCIQVRIRSNH